ncbi:hypothetical protein TBS_05780 [Thermobispora bispora]
MVGVRPARGGVSMGAYPVAARTWRPGTGRSLRGGPPGARTVVGRRSSPRWSAGRGPAPPCDATALSPPSSTASTDLGIPSCRAARRIAPDQTVDQNILFLHIEWVIR